ncbi:MAG: hypothetical protein LBT55_07550 [Clostridiaceae bacterium]|jgi:hypothetical protein|nr:hypothetical protein [Clostridiaceae bacterium]
MKLRLSSEVENFPYGARTLCYIEIGMDGKVEQVGSDFASVSAAYNNVINKQSRLYAVWPGQYRSDLFLIDNLNAFADSFGVPRPDEHVHDILWKLNAYDDGKSAYATVDIELKCGCVLKWEYIKKFANDMKAQLGWEVATSTGISGNGQSYTLRVKRSTLKNLL